MKDSAKNLHKNQMGNKTNLEGDEKSHTINMRRASVWGQIGAGLGIVASALGTKNHITSMLIAVLLTIIAICVAIYYYQKTKTPNLQEINPSNPILPSPIYAENQLSDFRLIRESGNTIWFEIWYYYNGVAGPSDKQEIYISARPVGSNGSPLPGTGGSSGGDIWITGSRALAKIELTHQPSKDDGAAESQEIEICMRHILNQEFYCQRFPLVKVWV